MAYQILSRLFVAMGVVALMFSTCLGVSSSALETGEELGEMKTGGLCKFLERLFHAWCYKTPPPSKFCNGFGGFLMKACDFHPSCFSVTAFSFCLPGFICGNNVLPYGSCPQGLECCASFHTLTAPSERPPARLFDSARHRRL